MYYKWKRLIFTINGAHKRLIIVLFLNRATMKTNIIPIALLFPCTRSNVFLFIGNNIN